MDHPLVGSVEKALGWNDSRPLGTGFAHGSMDDPALCQQLLTPTRLLDMIMRRSLGFPQFRVFQNGEELHPDRYLGNTVTRRGQSLSMARMDRLGQLIAAGCTIVLDSLDSFDPTLEIACQAMQWWSRELVQVNTYLTTADAAGFDLHWDDHDVVVVQLGGEKSWEVRGPSRVAPMYRDAETAGEPPEMVLWRGTMRAGDVMHIPRGYWHQATRTDRANQTGDDDAGYSLHATFGFVKRTGADWLAWVADRSRTLVEFRHDLDRANTNAGELAALVPQLLADHPQQVYLVARELERAARRRVTTHGTFGPLAGVVCLTDFPPHITATPEQVTVSAAGKEITFAARAERAVRMLLSGDPMLIEVVTDETGVPADTLARTLVQEGLCAELTDELKAGFLPVPVRQ
jgi:hypothetical protein